MPGTPGTPDTPDTPGTSVSGVRVLHTGHGIRTTDQRLRTAEVAVRSLPGAPLAVLVHLVVRVLFRLELERGVRHVEVLRKTCSQGIE